MPDLGHFGDSQPNRSSLSPDSSPDESDCPSIKRQKTAAGISTYREGSIVRISITNFMTYDQIEFNPGPSLNMIIGPNGSGKSSIVAAICIGLGFPPAIMGRAPKIEESIKFGKQTATIEIELQGSKGKNVVIFRQFSHGQDGGKGSSEWKLDGKKSGVKVVQETVRSMNIQIDNLCQFLPQDKVASFARLSPAALLVETEKTVGDGSMYSQHESLISLEKEKAAEEMRILAEQEKLKSFQSKQEAAERDVQRLRERETLKKDIRIRELRLPFALYASAKEEYMLAKGRYAEAKRTLTEVMERNQPLTQMSDELEANVEKARKDVKSSKVKLASANKELEGLAAPLTKLGGEVRSLEDKMKAERAAERNAKDELRALKETVQQNTRSLGPKPNVDDEVARIALQIRKLNEDSRAVRGEANTLYQFLQNRTEQRSEVQAQIDEKTRSVEQLGDVRAMRKAWLEKSSRDAADAVAWYGIRLLCMFSDF